MTTFSRDAGTTMPRLKTHLALVLALAAIGARAGADEPPTLSIEGYTGRLSYRAGDVVDFHVSTTAPKYALEVARLGEKTEVVVTRSGLPGASHPIPEDASSQGCGW